MVLGEKIYMDQPIGFEVKEQGCKVCRLKRSIYGLKQDSRQWSWYSHYVLEQASFAPK